MSTTKKTTTATKRTTKSVTKNSKSDPPTEKSTELKVRKLIDPNTIVTVTNGFQGVLVCQNKRTQETFIWENYGDEQELTFGDLRTIFSSDKEFFINNWFLIDNPEVLEALNATRFYKNSLGIDGMETLFDNDSDTIMHIVNGLTDAQKRTVAYKARNMIVEKTLDSISKIEALEESLGILLLER